MQIFGGYSELQNAPADTVIRQTLIWQARRAADAEQPPQAEQYNAAEMRRKGGG